MSSERRSLPFAEETARAGRALTRALQYPPATFSPGYNPPVEAWLTNNKGHEEVETAMRFPFLHTPDGTYLNSTIAALH